MEDADDASMRQADAPPRTPSQGNSDDEDASDKNSDSGSNSNSDEEEEEEQQQKRRRAYKPFKRRDWEELGRWDPTALLESEINAAILQLATKHMTDSGLVEWPAIKKDTKMKRLALWAQHDAYARDNGATTIETYHCPLKGRCKCPCQIRIVRTPTLTSLECSGGEHTQAACHATDASLFLNFKQRQAVAKVVKTNPSLTGAEVRRAVSRGSPSGKIRAGLIRSVRSVVRVQKQHALASLTGGLIVTDAYSSIAALGDRLWFGDILKRHNSGEKHFSNPHEVFCIGNVSPEAAGEEIFLNLATCWSILHIARGHVAGWPNCLSGDGTGKVSKRQVTMVSLGINSIPAKFNTLNYCIGPVENQDLFTQAWDGVEKTYFAFMNKWKCCNMSYAHCGVCAMISQFRTEPLVLEHIGETGDKKLIEKAKSDNTDLFRNFAESISAIPLVCDAHGASNYFQYYILNIFDFLEIY